MKAKFRNIEGQIELTNRFANELFQAELEKYRNRLDYGLRSYDDPLNYDFFRPSAADQEVDRVNKAIEEENKRELEAQGVKGWVVDRNNDLAPFQFVGINLTFSFTPLRELGFDIMGGTCTNVVGDVEISLTIK